MTTASNVDRTKTELEALDTVERVTVAPSDDELVFHALVDETDDDFEELVDQMDLTIAYQQFVGLGTEVKLE